MDGEDLAVGENLVRRRYFLDESGAEVEVEGGFEEERIGGETAAVEFDGNGVGFPEIVGERDSRTGEGIIRAYNHRHGF